MYSNASLKYGVLHDVTHKYKCNYGCILYPAHKLPNVSKCAVLTNAHGGNEKRLSPLFSRASDRLPWPWVLILGKSHVSEKVTCPSTSVAWRLLQLVPWYSNTNYCTLSNLHKSSYYAPTRKPEASQIHQLSIYCKNAHLGTVCASGRRREDQINFCVVLGSPWKLPQISWHGRKAQPLSGKSEW